MKLKKLVERNDEESNEENPISLDFFTDARTQAIGEALRFVGASCINSGMRFVKVEQDIGEDKCREFIVLDAEDAEAQTVQGLTQELLEFCDYSYELGGNKRNPDVLFIVADMSKDLLTDEERDRLSDSEE